MNRKMKPRKIASIVILLLAAVLWVTAISSATNGGFTTNDFAVQAMVLGGAVSMIAGLFAFVLD